MLAAEREPDDEESETAGETGMKPRRGVEGCLDCDDVAAVQAATSQAQQSVDRAKKQQSLGFGIGYQKPTKSSPKQPKRATGGMPTVAETGSVFALF